MAAFFQSYFFLIALGVLVSILVWMVYHHRNSEEAETGTGTGMGCCGGSQSSGCSLGSCGGCQTTRMSIKNVEKITATNKSCH